MDPGAEGGAGDDEGGTGDDEGGDTKPEDGTGDDEGESKDGEEGESKDEGEVSYEDFQIEEGVTLNEEVMGEFTDFAKGIKLSQENAQVLADLGQKLVKQQAEQQQLQQAEIVAGWKEEISSDAEFGGAGLTQTVERANRTIRAFVPEGEERDALVGFLSESGVGNHPSVIKMFARIDKKVNGTSMVEPEANKSDTNKNPEERMAKIYPSMSK